MAMANLHIGTIYTYYNLLMVFIIILDHENMGIDSMFVTLLCVLSTIFNKICFSIMAVLICI